jgi:hypothetical protein
MNGYGGEESAPKTVKRVKQEKEDLRKGNSSLQIGPMGLVEVPDWQFTREAFTSQQQRCSQQNHRRPG